MIDWESGLKFIWAIIDILIGFFGSIVLGIIILFLLFGEARHVNDGKTDIAIRSIDYELIFRERNNNDNCKQSKTTDWAN